MFCYQRNFFTPTQEVTREQFWALVGAPYTKEIIDGVRAAKSRGDEAEAARLKKRLPAFIFQATFDESQSKSGLTGRWRKQAATRLNGLVVLDVDHVDDPAGLVNGKLRMENGKLVAREEWAAENNCQLSILNCQLGSVLLVYVTPSGAGLKVVFKADAAKGNLIDNMNAMASVLGVEADQACKDASRMSFICTREDILFINENELFDYENKEFAEKYNGEYRSGRSQSAVSGAPCGDVAAGGADGCGGKLRVSAADEGGAGGAEPAALLTYGGWTGTCQELMAEIYRETGLPGEQPEGRPRLSRHTESLARAYDLLVMTGRNRERTEQLLRSLPWVDAIVRERHENVAQTVADADSRVAEQERKYGENVKPKKKCMDAIRRLVKTAKGEGGDEELPLDEWGAQIAELAPAFPCMTEALTGLPVGGYAAGLFTAAAFMGTLMTRTWYYFYHRPEERRRLNYCIFVIGDPASGKSFATRLYKLLAAPIKVKDKVGYDAVNRYKADTQQKAANKEKPKKPVVVIRDHPARTSNATFIQDMNNAVETVDGEPMHLHMLTFDSELDNATLTQRGGSWIDKTSLELKAFHNEEDGQAYSNLDSISGEFNVYWHFVYTGTPLSLNRKVTERNFGSGLATRLACIPLPPSGFKMMALSRKQTTNHAADELLKMWAFRLDEVKGELPLWPLVEEAWNWTNERMQVAAFDDDHADELLLKRVAYYGIGISTPFIVMRHWDEWKEKKTLSIDDTDLKLCRLAMNIQYRCQHHFFGEYARIYFDNQTRDAESQRRRPSKYDAAYQQLPEEFTADDVVKVYGNTQAAAKVMTSRLCRDGYVERLKQGTYKKLKKSLR